MASPIDAIIDATTKVTKAWAKQRRDEERDRNAILNRHYRLVKSVRTTIREVAFEVMEEAFLKASDNGSLPVKPRQIMYAARPHILARADTDNLDGQYFSQQLLIDYMEQYGCDGWDIVWDSRGNFIEPHTGVHVPLGTLEVRQYLGERPTFARTAPQTLSADAFPTVGPEHRYRNVLFIEKEGFHPILQADGLLGRLDTAIMSTKGMSTTAARKLLDSLSPRIQTVFVLHDFDISGFSIAGTLYSDSPRYSFSNHLAVVDIGLRLADVETMDLESEPTSIPSNEWPAREHTLRRHGASPQEIAFLRQRRVELNAMTSRQFVDFVEEKLLANGVEKVIPDDDVLEGHARRVLEARLTNQEIAKIRERIDDEVKGTALPSDLHGRIKEVFAENPEVSWDAAVAQIMTEAVDEGK